MDPSIVDTTPIARARGRVSNIDQAVVCSPDAANDCIVVLPLKKEEPPQANKRPKLVRMDAPDVDVAQADGTAVVTGVSASLVSGTTGTYSYTLSAANNATLNRLTLTWKDGGSTRSTRYVDVVGGFYFTIAELRARKGLESEAKFSTERLIATRDRIQSIIERDNGVAYVPRYKRVRVDGSGKTNLLLPHPVLRSVRSVRTYSDATTYTSFSAAQIAAIPQNTIGMAERTDGSIWTCGKQNLLVEYEHGYDNPPDDLKQAALDAAQYFIFGDTATMSPRALDVVGEWGTVRYSTPGADRPTGIPDVDAVIVANRLQSIGVA